ncbi:MAG TPA: c-type cytochrome domain-containing protein [Polyangiaceae bacterium]|nr:c-type cytochrome domain-containing protein [Polyangiaceae bacterium]
MLRALGVLALVAGCDGEDRVELLSAGGRGSEAGAGGTGSIDPGRDAGTDPPDAAGGMAGAGGTGDAGAGGVRDYDDELDLLATSALALITRECGGCHGGNESAGGVGAIDDITQLIVSGLIIPGSAESSPLFESIRSGRMPPPDMPPGSLRSRLTVGEQWLIEGFIDSIPWDEECRPVEPVGIDAAYGAMLADVMAQPEADRRYIRYVNLSGSLGEGCGRPLQEKRWALFETVNGTSLNPELHVPVAIDANELIYRIDTRHYAWERRIDLVRNGFDSEVDGWQAVVDAAGSYGVLMQGPEADALREATRTDVPVLPGGALVWAANRGELYYELVGARLNIFDTQIALGIDVIQNMDDGVVRRAAFSRVVDPREVIVERHPQASAGRSYWSLLPQRTWGAASIYGDPVDNDRVAEQTIWQLPNGLFAYSAATQDGDRLDAQPDTCEDCGEVYPAGGNPAGCHACHQRGLAPVKDSVFDYIQRNRRDYDVYTVAAVEQIYAPGELDAQMAADNAVYFDALAGAGVPPLLPGSSLSRAFRAFEGHRLDVLRVAAELETTPDTLRASLGRLPASFAPLAEISGSISREEITEAQQAARCVLSEGARNRPVECP